MRGANTMALRDQLTRAAMSVPADIVEGSAHTSPREFARFVQYALASASELEGLRSGLLRVPDTGYPDISA